MLRLLGHLRRGDWRKLNHATNYKRTQIGTKKGDLNNNIAEHHLGTSHTIDWDSATCFTNSTDYYRRITLESWFTDFDQTNLNKSLSTLSAPQKQLLNRNQ